MSLHSIERGLNIETHLALKSNEILIANKDVPLSRLVQIGIASGKFLDAERRSHAMDEAYYRWQSVRLAGVPLSGKKDDRLVTCKTGLEGYFVGSVKSQEELAQELLQIGESIWKSIRIMHKHAYSKRKRMEETITGNGYDQEAAFEWLAILGATIARLRAKLLTSKEGQEFRNSTRSLTQGLPKIQYGLDRTESGLIQAYKLPIKGVSASEVTGIHSSDEEKLYWETVQNLGVFGHPLVRALLKELYR